jgi:AbrB family looped-hinge helix DNA binding protein
LPYFRRHFHHFAEGVRALTRYISIAEILHFCYNKKMMQETTFLTERGTLTLPASIRKSLGLEGKQQLIVETTDNGEIVLRPAAVVPVEIYTEERIAEFTRDDKALAKLLKRHGI